MASSADLLLDTSAALPLLLGDHVGHEPVAALTRGAVLGLAGHAAYESFSVLTRLPQGLALTADAAWQLLQGSFPATHSLSASGGRRLLASLARLGISGGSVFDALVGGAAVEAGLPLVSRDRRALHTYAVLGVDARFAE